MTEPAGKAAAQAAQISQYLTFTLDGGRFAIDIERTREVLAFTSTTKVPRTPDFMRGVINLRGHVVPVIDLRLKFGLARTEKTVNTCVIILEVEVDGSAIILGALADSVQEVIELASDQLAPPPKIGTRINTDYIRGIGRRDDDFIMILDIDRVLTADDIRATTTGLVGSKEDGAVTGGAQPSIGQGAGV
jgi:purine-binding chemotaxis protein CheW